MALIRLKGNGALFDGFERRLNQKHHAIECVNDGKAFDRAQIATLLAQNPDVDAYIILDESRDSFSFDMYLIDSRGRLQSLDFCRPRMAYSREEFIDAAGTYVDTIFRTYRPPPRFARRNG